MGEMSSRGWIIKFLLKLIKNLYEIAMRLTLDWEKKVNYEIKLKENINVEYSVRYLLEHVKTFFGELVLGSSELSSGDWS